MSSKFNLKISFKFCNYFRVNLNFPLLKSSATSFEMQETCCFCTKLYAIFDLLLEYKNTKLKKKRNLSTETWRARQREWEAQKMCLSFIIRKCCAAHDNNFHFSSSATASTQTHHNSDNSHSFYFAFSCALHVKSYQIQSSISGVLLGIVFISLLAFYGFWHMRKW